MVTQAEGAPLVWPGVSALSPSLFWQQQQPLPSSSQPDDASKAKAQQHAFSFDWSRGRSSSGKPGAVPGFLSGFTYGEGLPFTSRQRWKHFVMLLMLSGAMFMLAGCFLPLVLLRPQKFCLFFTLGSMLSMASFAVLRGPLEQLKHMFSLQRLPFTSAYMGSILLTLYAALVLHSYLLVLLFSALQAATVVWYLLSYMPGGARVLRVLTHGSLRALALCCRGRFGGTGASALSPWGSGSSGSWGSGSGWSSSSGLLPL